VSGAGPALDRREAAELYRRLHDRTPSPQTELEFVNNYTLLVAVVLSAQATDASVNLATRDLFRAVSTPEAMVALGEEGLKRHIRTIGLFNTKAKNVIALSQALIDRHGGEVPEDFEALQALPGVGRKTANVVMNCAFGAETFAVDTHVFRVSNRTGLAPGKDVLEVERRLDSVTPPPWRRDAHHLLILHGRYVSTAAMSARRGSPNAGVARSPTSAASSPRPRRREAKPAPER
jgi:endonuclease III